MSRLGLVDMDGQSRFTLRAAFNRLLDVCLDETRRPANSATTDTATDQTTTTTNTPTSATTEAQS
jgi:hypothetical protein